MAHSKATSSAATLAKAYLVAVQELIDNWRSRLSASVDPRADSAAWKLIDILPAHPMITAPVAGAAVQLSKPPVYKGIQELQAAGILIPLSGGSRNQSWEAVGLLDLLAQLEAGELPGNWSRTVRSITS